MTLQFSIKGLWVGAIQVVIFLILTTIGPILLGGLTKWIISIIWLSSWSLSLIFFDEKEKYSLVSALLINSLSSIFLFAVNPLQGALLIGSSLTIPMLHYAISKFKESTVAYIIGPATVFYVIYLIEKTIA